MNFTEDPMDMRYETIRLRKERLAVTFYVTPHMEIHGIEQCAESRLYRVIASMPSYRFEKAKRCFVDNIVVKTEVPASLFDKVKKLFGFRYKTKTVDVEISSGWLDVEGLAIPKLCGLARSTSGGLDIVMPIISQHSYRPFDQGSPFGKP